MYFFLSARQRAVNAKPFSLTVHLYNPVPGPWLTNVSRSPAGSGHDAILLHFRQAKVCDHDFGVLFRSKVKKVFRL